MSPADVGGLLAFADIDAKISGTLMDANNLHTYPHQSRLCFW